MHPECSAAELLQHYRTSTSETIATDADDVVLWKHTVVELASDHGFLMSGILSLTALHLAHLQPERRCDYAIRAGEYQDQAMPLFRKAIAQPDGENCDAILVFTHLLVLYSLASQRQPQPQPQQGCEYSLFLATNDPTDVVPTWLYLIRNGCCMLCDYWDVVGNGPCKTLTLAWDAPFDMDASSGGRDDLVFEDLRSKISIWSVENGWSEDVRTVLQGAASELALAFACSASTPETFTTWDALRVWPMRISAEFIELLQALHPVALVLLAHYCLLLRRIESKWYFDGQATRLLGNIAQRLDPKWQSWLPTI
jgi:hypothetical protein